MHYRVLPVLSLTVWATGASLLPNSASAVPLTRAVVQDVRNQVRLLLKNQAPRPAQRSDTLTPGDAVATARSALAELRFNDNSVARIGEQTLFRFQPNTRIFRLDNGTALLLIPPGQGRTRIQTPNAAAGIRGSALFVRYNPDTNTTLVGALTNSQIEVTNQDESQSQPLKAGQMAVIVQSKITRVYDFDLNTFYETSELVKGLDLPRRGAASSDAAIAAVQAETAEALRDQAPIVGQGTIDTPGFVRLLGQSTALPPTGQNVAPLANSFSPITGLPTELQRPSWLSPGQTGGQAVSRVAQPSIALPVAVVNSGLVTPLPGAAIGAQISTPVLPAPTSTPLLPTAPRLPSLSIPGSGTIALPPVSPPPVSLPPVSLPPVPVVPPGSVSLPPAGQLPIVPALPNPAKTPAASLRMPAAGLGRP